MVDGDRLVDLDHHGVVHSHDADKVSEPVREIHCVDLELFLLPVEINVNDEVALEELASDVRAPVSGLGQVGSEIKDEAVRLSGSDEH